MKSSGKFYIVKDIPLVGGGKIAKGEELYLVDDIFYLTGGMVGQEYQEDFMQLLKKEAKQGWKYLKPTEFEG